MESVQQQQLITAAATAIGVLIVIRRTLNTQTMRVWMLPFIPLLILALALLTFAATPFSSSAAIAIVIGLIGGAALGYARGIHSQVKLGPRPGTMVVKGSLLLVAILLLAFGVRYGLRWYFAGTNMHLTSALTDGFMAFAAGTVTVARGMLYVAYRRLLNAPPTAPAVPGTL